MKNHCFNIMEEKTKFNINETVWVVSDNKVIQRRITGIEISIEDSDQPKITYDTIGGVKYSEQDVFKTKQELIDLL